MMSFAYSVLLLDVEFKVDFSGNGVLYPELFWPFEGRFC